MIQQIVILQIMYLDLANHFSSIYNPREQISTKNCDKASFDYDLTISVSFLRPMTI